MKRTVFFISDGTGITAEALGNALLSQFEGIEFERIILPYIDTLDKARPPLPVSTYLVKKMVFVPSSSTR